MRIKKLQTHLRGLSLNERQRLAREVGTSYAHLRNCGYGSRVLATQHCVRIEELTQGHITRQELRPDWSLHWPELRKLPKSRVVKPVADAS